MSINCYPAWRIKVSELAEFDRLLNNHVYEQAKSAIDVLSREVSTDTDKVNNILDSSPIIKQTFGERAGEIVRLNLAIESTVEASLDSYRSPGQDMDCGYRIFVDGKYFVIWPWGEKSMYEGFDKAPDWSYWDNTDRPDEVTAQAWRRRKESWNSINENQRFYRDLIKMSDTIMRGIFCEKIAADKDLDSIREDAWRFLAYVRKTG